MDKPEINFKDPFLCMVNGITDSGKSTGLKQILEEIDNQRIAIVDYHNEYTELDHLPNVDRFVPNAKQRNNSEARMRFLKDVMSTIKQIGYDIIVLEEFNQYVKTRHDTPDVIESLKNNHAHDEWNYAKVFFVMRRPTQTDADFRENAHYFLIWRVTGSTTLKSYSKIAEGLDDAVKSLEDYEFVFKDKDNSFFTISAFDINTQE